MHDVFKLSLRSFQT